MKTKKKNTKMRILKKSFSNHQRILLKDHSSFVALNRMSKSELLNSFIIHFEGEGGVDASGL